MGVGVGWAGWLRVGGWLRGWVGGRMGGRVLLGGWADAGDEGVGVHRMEGLGGLIPRRRCVKGRAAPVAAPAALSTHHHPSNQPPPARPPARPLQLTAMGMGDLGASLGGPEYSGGTYDDPAPKRAASRLRDAPSFDSFEAAGGGAAAPADPKREHTCSEAQQRGAGGGGCHAGWLVGRGTAVRRCAPPTTQSRQAPYSPTLPLTSLSLPALPCLPWARLCSQEDHNHAQPLPPAVGV